MARGSGNKRGRGGGTTRQAALRQQQNQNKQNRQQQQPNNRDQNDQPTQQHHMQPIEPSAKDIVISDEKKKEIIHNDVTDILEKDLNCAICREVYINPLLLNCSHSFCRFCAYHWLNKRPGCPTCRVTVTFQAENLALRNVINSMYQKLEETHQTKRASVVSQRLKDEEQQEKDGVIPQILKESEANQAGNRRDPSAYENPNYAVYRMMLAGTLRGSLRPVPNRRARNAALVNIRAEEQRNDPDFTTHYNPANAQYSSDSSDDIDSSDTNSSESSSDPSDDSSTSDSETSSDDNDDHGNEDEMMFEDNVLDVINRNEFEIDHPLNDPNGQLYDSDGTFSDFVPSPYPEMSTESETSSSSESTSSRSTLLQDSDTHDGDTSSDEQDEIESSGLPYPEDGRSQRNRPRVRQLLPGYISHSDSDDSSDDDDNDEDDDDDGDDDDHDEHMSLAFDDRYSNNSTVEYGTSSDEFSP